MATKKKFSQWNDPYKETKKKFSQWNDPYKENV